MVNKKQLTSVAVGEGGGRPGEDVREERRKRKGISFLGGPV